MHPTVQQIAIHLREVRETRAISQRRLGERIGLTQAQISRFEGGRADLRLGSLVELARGLDLEVVLVPRRKVPAVEALAGRGRGRASRESCEAPGRQGGLPGPGRADRDAVHAESHDG